MKARFSSKNINAVFNVCVALASVSATTSYAQFRNNREQVQFFESKIRPVLVSQCYECHSTDSSEIGGKLLLDSPNGIREGGESGPAIVPGRPSSSLLLLAIQHSEPKLAMPPKDYADKLPDAVIRDFERWIREGAVDPRSETQIQPTYAADEAKQWWAWQPIVEAVLPNVKNEPWAKGDIDKFVLAQLEASNLTPSAPAKREELVRRLAFDVTGLPPTKEQLERFAFSEKPLAIEHLVDELLDSPQYGERMARHWLDVARYAESSGKEVNTLYPQAWRYRDYVIDSFNSDKPFNEFLTEQLAGDLLKSKDSVQQTQKLVATGFLSVGPKSLGEMNPRQFAVDLADEQIDAVSQAFLGVTIACARCHDHKFDPISQKDYTAMAGIFLSTQTHFGTTGGVNGRNKSDLVDLPASDAVATGRKFSNTAFEQLKIRSEELRAEQRELIAERAKNRGSSQDTNNNELLRVNQQLIRLDLEIASRDADGNPIPQAMAVTDKPAATFRSNFVRSRLNRPGNNNTPGRARFIDTQLQTIVDSPLLIRGEIDKPADAVPRGLPEFLGRDYSYHIPPASSGRMELAEWLTDKSNPLTPRVISNRVWSWLFGKGIVSSLDNFGTTGDVPSHPELLDYLASELVASNWSIKALVREIVLSQAYQQTSEHREDAFLVDPDNRLLWRSNRKPLEAECLRDGMLAVSQELVLMRPVGSLIAESGDGQLGGPRGLGVSENDIVSAETNYRSIYLPAPRQVLPSSMELFDVADNSMVSGMRDTTIVPSQALYWMNNEHVEKHCQSIVQQLLDAHSAPPQSAPRGRLREVLRNRVLGSNPSSESPRRASEIAILFDDLTLMVLSRHALSEETDAATAFVLQQQKTGAKQSKIWTSICRSLFASADYRFLK
ncbi:MAG: PSD1 domain-containing protein [Planctomycetales bacterium]|nr:PSD1 domain-containing protein [Planctomycetales bacterium]